MRVRALRSFVSPHGSASEGDVLDLPAPVAVEWITGGLVERVDPRIEEATLPRPETAVTRKGKR